ncbi:hypothetical protein BDF14DRAFT_1882641 [Spinellus fusiger]|nr:hypothetical protein BDF14DRAFT_1882641 [Spinellus fusiger]
MTDNGTSAKNSCTLPLDLALYHHLEQRTQDLSSEFMATVERLQTQVQQMTAWTADAGEVYVASVRLLSQEIQACSDKTVQLITHCDELDKDFSQLVDLSRQIQGIDKALSQLQLILQ